MESMAYVNLTNSGSETEPENRRSIGPFRLTSIRRRAVKPFSISYPGFFGSG